MKPVDSSVVVDINRGDVKDRVDRLDQEGRHAISVVTLTELRLGVNHRYPADSEGRTAALEGLARLVARFELLYIDWPVAETAADIIADLSRHGDPLPDLHDVYIAAAARAQQLPVLATNV